MAVKDMEEKGFVTEDTVVLQAHVKADCPPRDKVCAYVFTATCFRFNVTASLVLSLLVDCITC